MISTRGTTLAGNPGGSLGDKRTFTTKRGKTVIVGKTPEACRNDRQIMSLRGSTLMQARLECLARIYNVSRNALVMLAINRLAQEHDLLMFSPDALDALLLPDAS